MQPKKLIFTHCPHHQRRWTPLLVALFLGVGSLLMLARPAAAATITVDGTNCTLVEAIDSANNDNAAGNGCANGSGADTITLQTDVTLTASNNGGNEGDNGLPQISSAITIEGGGHTLSRGASAPLFRFFFVQAGGALTLNRLTLSKGDALDANYNHGGAIFNRGTVTVNNSTFSGNNGDYGGAIYNLYRATLTVNNSTFSGNNASTGGGIANSAGTATVNNSTFSGNTANQRGGGIYNAPSSTLTLARSLFSGNSASAGAELWNDPGMPDRGKPGGTVNAANYNLFGHDSNPGTSGFTPSGSDIVPGGALATILSALADNGGGMQTHALVAGSPAIDAAPHGSIATDQRGVSRPQGAADDIGAFEVQAAASAPNLNVDGAGVSLVNGNQVNVPVKFAGNGKQIASVGFVLNYDTACLSFDPTDSDNDGIVGVITGLPAAFTPSISHNTNQKLEVALYSNPVVPLTDGTLFTVQFTVKPACLPTAATPTKTMAVGFDASPAPSFGDATGVDVAGTTTDGTITLTYGNSVPTALALSNNKVTDGSLVGTTVGTLSTLDPDSGDSFTYSLNSSTSCPGADNASFQITGNTLKTGVAVDYATKSSYTICLRSTDSGGLYVEQSFTILVIGTPVAVDDLVNPRTKVLLSGELQVLNVLANDQAKGPQLNVVGISQPEPGKGSATINNGINVSYSAPATGNGTARFTYEATNGDFTSNSANVEVSYVANDQRGDCNANGSVTAADFIATVLEIFDTVGDKDADNKPAWWLIYNGSYAGSPRGCDANGLGNGTDPQNLTDSVTAADITCTVLIFFGHPCGTGVQAAGAMQAAHLAVADQQANVGANTTLTATLNTGGNAIAAATFALGLDPAVLRFDTADADEDGVPDAITLHTPAGMSKSVTWNAAANRLEVAVFGMSLPLPTLTDGTLATVTIAVANDTTATSTPLALDLVSFSDADGNDLPFTDQDGALTIIGAPAAPSKAIFLPLVVR